MIAVPRSIGVEAEQELSMKLLCAILVLLFTIGQNTATAQDAKAAMAKLRTSCKEVTALQELASSPLKGLRRKQPVRAARAAMRMLYKKLQKMGKPAQESGVDAANAICETFSKNLGDFVKLAEDGIAVATEAVNEAEGLEKEFLTLVRRRLFVQAATLEIRSFFVNNRSVGTYDGMFKARTAKLGRDGARAMLDLFTDFDHPENIRGLAGEGVAQLGNKEDIAAVRSLFDDTVENQTLRTKAMYVLARLGDRGPFDKERAKHDATIKELEDKTSAASGKIKKLLEEHNQLKAVETPTDEQKKRAGVVQKELRETDRRLTNDSFRLGNEHNRRAVLFQEIRDREATEACYKSAIKSWLRIEARVARDPQARGALNISFYNLACVQSLQGKIDPAIGSMDQCFRWGYRNFDWIQKDGDLEKIRSTEKFKALVEEVKSGKAAKRWKSEAEARKQKASGKKDGDAK